MTRIASLALAALLVPATALAAPAWDNQQNQGAPGKVTQLSLLSPGMPGWNDFRGTASIGGAGYEWGGTRCDTDLTAHQYAALSLALLHGLKVDPTYRSVTGSNRRCLVLFTIWAPVSK